MSPRAPKKCGDPSCETRVTGSTYCPDHRRAKAWTSTNRLTGTPSRTGTTAWRKIRAACIARDGNRCRGCGADGRLVRLECDHITPVSQGGTDALSNAQMLCAACHRPKTQAEARAGRCQ